MRELFWNGAQPYRYFLIAMLAVSADLFAAAGPWDNPPALPAPTGTIVNVQAGNVADLVNKVRAARSNTTILIPAGTYQLSDSTGPMRIGANSAVTNVTLRGATNNRADVVIRGPGMSVDSSATVPHCLMIEQAKDILVANLSIGDVWYHPITVQGTSYADRVHLYNCRLFDAGEQFLKCNPLNADGTPDGNGYSGASDGIVEYCVFEFTTTARDWYTEGIDVHAGHRWIVRYNLFQKIRGPAGAALVGGAVDFWNRSSDNTVESNTIFDCEVGIRLGVLDRDGYNDHSGGIIRNNFIYRAAGSTNQSDVGIIVNDSPNTQVLHNTVLLNGTYSNAIEIRFATSTGGRVANNLCDANISLRDGATATLIGNKTNATSGLFVNAANADLHLLSTASSVINQVPVETNCQADWDGQTRPSGASADIGADEYVSAVPQPNVAFSATSSSGSESTTSVSIPVSLSAASTQSVTVAYSVTGGTASGNGNDFTLANGTLTFSAGTTTQNIALTVVNDSRDEPNETVQITLSSPTNATLGTNTVHTYMINDDDPTPTVAFSATSSSGAESVTSVSILVSLSAASGQTVTVAYAVTGGTASSGTDFTLANGTLTFNAGTTSQNISLTVNNDTIDEADETIQITLSSPTNATLGANTVHTYTILDNDNPPAVAFNASSSSGAESATSVSIPVSLSVASSFAVSVNYAVSGGTASGGGIDYTLTSGTLNFAIGVTTQNISLTIVNDSINEPDETIIITLSSPTNATLGTQISHTHTISNKFTPAITWNNPVDIAYPAALSATQLNASTTVAGTFTYTPPLGTVLSGGNAQTLSVQFTPTDTNANTTPAPKTVKINVLKGTAGVTLGNLTQGFDGSPKSATATTTPAGLSVGFTYNGATAAPSAIGSYSVVATINDANYSGSASGTLVISGGPSIDSAPSSSANPAIVGQSVQFTIGSTSPPPLTYKWDFGDGTVAFGGSSVAHVFNTTGTFTVTVTVSDGGGKSSSASMPLTVNANSSGGGEPGVDSDGDGVSDPDEIAVGTNPFNAASVLKAPMTVSKLMISMKFGVQLKDSIGFSGVIPGMPALFNPKDRMVTIDVSGARVILTLDTKGRAKNDSASLMLKLKGKRNKATKQFEFAGGDVPFKASLKHGTWSTGWSGIGVNPVQNAFKIPTNLVVDLALNGTVYTATVPTLYSAKAGKGGAFKK